MFERFRGRHPHVSTYLAALFLAMVWTGIWIIAFLLATAFLNLTTPTLIFVITLWFGVVAEAPIRWIENSGVVAQWSKPLIANAEGDNKDYSANRAMGFTVGFGLIPFFAFTSFIYFSGLTIEDLKLLGGEFSGAGATPTAESSVEMLQTWYLAFTNRVGVFGLVACILMRTVIYKRKIRTSDES